MRIVEGRFGISVSPIDRYSLCFAPRYAKTPEWFCELFNSNLDVAYYITLVNNYSLQEK